MFETNNIYSNIHAYNRIIKGYFNGIKVTSLVNIYLDNKVHNIILVYDL